MKTFLLDHLPNCTPLKPCASCEAAAFLRGKLSDADLQTFLEQVRKARAEFGEFSPDSPAPLDTPITTLEPLPNMVMNALRNHEIGTIGDLIKMTETDFLRIPNCGRQSLTFLSKALARVGRRLGEIPK